MRRCIQFVCLIVALAGAASAQMKMSVEQLATFVKSSVQLKEDDRKVAEMVKKIQLSNQLDAKTIESLQELGAGRLTVAALKALRTDSASLPAAPAPVAAPKLTAAPIPAPDSESQQKVLAAITQDALSYSEGLPNFICMQVTRRYVAQNGSDSFRLTDTIAERLSYFEHKEDYKVISVNGTPVSNRKHEQLGGATSSGEFGSMLYEIFSPESRTEFQWERWGKLRDHVMHVFSFRVRLENSKYSITAEEVKRTVTVGYHGLIYADRDSNSVMRITMEADDIPEDFPIRSASETLDYDSISLSGVKFILPLKVDMRMRDGRNTMKNQAEFRLYNKFGADTSIIFSDAPESLPEEKGAEPGK
ncbi:MAG TPA: hypothetical protein VLM42_08320 [Bryobacteraceae bacterium]|nr:hypothetical protein [Bryobacteraceae bacterium]